MTRDTIQAELDRDPFMPLRFHLASGKTIDIRYANTAFMMEHAVTIVHRLKPRTSAIGGYDVINLGFIEKVEHLRNGRRTPRPRKSA